MDVGSGVQTRIARDCIPWIVRIRVSVREMVGPSNTHLTVRGKCVVNNGRTLLIAKWAPN